MKKNYTVRQGSAGGELMDRRGVEGMLSGSAWSADVTDRDGRRTQYLEGGPGEQGRLTDTLRRMPRTGEGLEIISGGRILTVSVLG